MVARDSLHSFQEDQAASNEKLTTVKESNRNTELNRLNSDLTNTETAIKVAVILLGCDLTIRRFSVHAEKIFHLAASDIGRSIRGVRHNLRVPGLDAIAAGVIAHSRECEQEVQDKQDHWYSLRVRPYLNGEGKVDGAVLVLNDIDALKNTERLITVERELAEAVIRTVPNPLVVLNADLQIQTVNEAFTRIFQLTPKQVVGRSIFEVDRGSLNFSGLRHLLEDIIPKKRFFDAFEVTQKNQKLGERVFMLNARVLLENAGKPKQILLGIRDTTDRKLAENALRVSEERFRVLFDLGPVGVYSCSRDGTIQNFNQAAVKLWGRKPKLGDPRDRFCGASHLYRPDGTYVPHEACPMAAVLSGTMSEARDIEVILERRNGTRITIIVNIVSLKNAQGEITGAINCLYDITDRKRMDEALRASRVELADYADHLETKVAKRTAELTASNRKLKESIAVVGKAKEQYQQLFLESQIMQKKLRRLTHQIIEVQEEERKEISRELHDSVVQTLVGINVELSALGLGAATGGDALKAKIAHTQRLVESSVDAVHRFARELRPAVLDDLGLIPALHAFSKNLAASKKIKIELTAFRGVESLENGNRTVLFRVAQEALHNVVRHAHATLVKISLTSVADRIRMEVSDNGRSFQVKKTLLAKSNKRLGLVGMRERIEMVGGSLTIESAPGKGTTVRAEIPFNTKKIS